MTSIAPEGEGTPVADRTDVLSPTEVDDEQSSELEQCVADMQIGHVRAKVSARAKNLFGPSLKAALSVFVVTLATVLLLVVAPGQAAAILICWMLLSVIVVALSR